jgi:aldose sugar dehydrogenase
MNPSRPSGPGPAKVLGPSVLARRCTWAVALTTVACSPGPGAEPGEVVLDPPSPTELPSCFAEPPLPEVTEVAGGLETPWAMAQAPDGRIFLTERPGRIRVIDEGRLLDEPWATVPVVEESELGLMGIALDPGFATNGIVYVMGRFPADSEGRFPGPLAPLVRRFRAWTRPHDEGTAFVMNVERYVEVDGRATGPERIVSGIPARVIHGGGALAIDDRGRLLVAVGEAGALWRAQEPRSALGKILARENPAGAGDAPPRLPDDVVASGVRNSQGIELHPASGTVLFIDHGPSGLEPEAFRQDRDELNVLVPGGNYGWPTEAGTVRDPAFLAPVVDWSPAIAPAGLAVSDGPGGEGIVAWVTGLRGQALHRVHLVPDDGPAGWRAACQDRLLDGDFGRLRAVLVDDSGAVWVGTSNRDGRGRVRDGDDRILVVAPESVAP